jgi:hypothetical protein
MRILVWAFFALLSITANAQSGTTEKLQPGAVVNLPDQAWANFPELTTISAPSCREASQVLDRVQKREARLQTNA